MRRVLTKVFAVCFAAAGLILMAPYAEAGADPCIIGGGLAPPDTSYRNLTAQDCHGASAPANITTTIGTNVGNTALFKAGPDETVVGTGVIQPFVRIQNDGGDRANCVAPCIESGYNTEGVEQFETKDAGGHNWTHAIRLSQVGMDGDYRVFILDINERVGQGDSFLSLDKLQVYLGSDPNITGFIESPPDCPLLGPCAPEGFASTLLNPVPRVWDMDGFGQDVSIGLDYNLNHGSGKGIDLTVRIPEAAFQAAILGNPNLIENPYVYLYSSFGATGELQSDKQSPCQWSGLGPPPKGCPAGILPPGNYGQSAGFEEWSTLKGVPEPMSMALLLVGLAAIGFVRRQQPSPIAC